MFWVYTAAGFLQIAIAFWLARLYEFSHNDKIWGFAGFSIAYAIYDFKKAHALRKSNKTDVDA